MTEWKRVHDLQVNRERFLGNMILLYAVSFCAFYIFGVPILTNECNDKGGVMTTMGCQKASLVQKEVELRIDDQLMYRCKAKINNPDSLSCQEVTP